MKFLTLLALVSLSTATFADSLKCHERSGRFTVKETATFTLEVSEASVQMKLENFTKDYQFQSTADTRTGTWNTYAAGSDSLVIESDGSVRRLYLSQSIASYKCFSK